VDNINNVEKIDFFIILLFFCECLIASPVTEHRPRPRQAGNLRVIFGVDDNEANIVRIRVTSELFWIITVSIVRKRGQKFIYNLILI